MNSIKNTIYYIIGGSKNCFCGVALQSKNFHLKGRHVDLPLRFLILCALKNLIFRTPYIIIAALFCSTTAFCQSIDYLSFWKNNNLPYINQQQKWTLTPLSIDENLTEFCDTATTSGNNCLYHTIQNLYPEQGTIQWQFLVTCNVKNTSVNNFKIILFANDSIFGKSNYQAFAIGTGLKTGIYSQLCLLKYTGTDYDILAATDIMFDNTINIKTLNIARTSKGEWILNNDTIYKEPLAQLYFANYLSFEYKHSTTGNGAFKICPQKFEFNYTGNTINAKLNNAQIIGNGIVTIGVDGRINPISALNKNNYLLNNTNPDSIQFQENSITLYFNSKTFSNTQLILTANNITQIDGNIVDNFTDTLLLPMYGDIVINEIMCDISPAPANLPASKYIELYNTTPFNFNLKNCQLYINDYIYDFPEIELNANQYLLICRTDSLDKYAKTSKGLDDTKLTTKDKKLTIVNQSQQIIDSLTYNTDMYGNKAKSQGGYSIERRDPNNKYMVNGNWTVSIDISGGTPGRINSTLSTVVDNTPPIVTSVSIVDNNTLKIVLSKNIIANNKNISLNNKNPIEYYTNLNTIIAKFSDPHFEGNNTLKINQLSDYVGNLSNDTTIVINYQRLKLINIYAASNYQLYYQFNNNIEHNEATIYYADKQPNTTIKYNGNSVFVTFEQYFTPNTKLNASVCNIQDIYGNIIDSVSDNFIYHNTVKNDILINEVLFYPQSGAKRFIEIYNNSPYPIPLNDFSIAYYNNKQLERESTIKGNYLLESQQYAIITTDSTDIKNHYNCGGIFIQDTKLPAFANTQGSLVLRNNFGTTIDSMYYSQTDFNTLEINIQGISLERISFNTNSTEISNWRFTSSSVGYATPGLPNSRTQTQDSVVTNSINIVNELFTPNGDGYHDEVEIVISSIYNNTAVDITIYDQNGFLKRNIASHTNIGNGASFFWDGLSNNGDFCKTGIYIIYIKTISPNGKTDMYKKVCVLNRK